VPKFNSFLRKHKGFLIFSNIGFFRAEFKVKYYALKFIRMYQTFSKVDVGNLCPIPIRHNL
jgi:hypothetical protein